MEIGTTTIRTTITTFAVSSFFHKSSIQTKGRKLKLLQQNLSVFSSESNVLLEDLFLAYYECRKNKRRTTNALSFELNFEQELIKLCQEIISGRYEIGRSIAFIIKYPVQREVFAADFRDRIVHHFVISKINNLLEKEFIANSYNCRKGKGVLCGVKSIYEQMYECSQAFTKDCYILKLDIRSFFMSINKHLLYQRLYTFLFDNYHGADKMIILRLVKQIIYYRPEDRCYIKGQISDWNGLPCHKSLFWSEGHCGLPIGNLTSQIFANFYLTSFDKFVTETLGLKYYGRYVDDFVIIHESKQELLQAHKKIKEFLAKDLRLELHPKKFYLQHYTKGVKFIGAMIKPNRIYIEKRSKGNLYRKINEILPQMAQGVDKTFDEIGHFMSSVNSYLGIMRHYNTYRLRRKILNEINNTFLRPILEEDELYEKISLNNMFTPKELKKRQLRNQRKYRKLSAKRRMRGLENGIIQSTSDIQRLISAIT